MDIQILRTQYLPPALYPLHQWPHTQLAGDGQRLVQQSYGIGTVSFSIPLFKRVGIVAASPCQVGPGSLPYGRRREHLRNGWRLGPGCPWYGKEGQAFGRPLIPTISLCRSSQEDCNNALVRRNGPHSERRVRPTRLQRKRRQIERTGSGCHWQQAVATRQWQEEVMG